MNIDITTTFSPTKVRSYFSLKDSTPVLLKSGVVYRFSCQIDPGISYIGRTSRHLFKRIHEHKKSGLQIASHLQNCSKCKDCVQPSFTVVDQSTSAITLNILEALHINEKSPSLNKQVHNSGASFLLKIF